MKTRRIGPFEVSHRAGLHEPQPRRPHAAAGAGGASAAARRARSRHRPSSTPRRCTASAPTRSCRPHARRRSLEVRCWPAKCGLHGVDGKRVVDGRPETLKWSCEQSLKRLRTDRIDLFYLHRWDRNVPIEDSVGALGDLVRAGKVRCDRPLGSVGRDAQARAPCTPSPRCRPSIRCGRATRDRGARRLPRARAPPSSPSARWHAAFSPGRCATWPCSSEGPAPQHAALRAANFAPT